MSKIAIFGDVSAQYDPFYAGLVALGVTEDLKIPEDLTIIQVGDLVHKGPDSDKVVAMVATLIENNPDQWIQLFGNHEGQYLGGPEFWSEDPDLSTIETIRYWRVDKKAKMAVGLVDLDTDEKLLVTHAGLTPSFWHKHCLRSREMSIVVEHLNELAPTLRFKPGIMLNGEPIHEASPAWAHCIAEVYVPWLQAQVANISMPFSQVHGHTTPYFWGQGSWGRNAPEKVIKRTELDFDKRHSFTTLDKKTRFISTDPGFGKFTSVEAMSPFIIENGEILA